MVVAIPRLAARPAIPAVPAGWTFPAETIIGRVQLGPMPVHGFSATMRLNGFGNGQATLPAAPGLLDQERLLRLWSWRLWAYYGGQPVWCGVPTGIADDGGGYVTLTLTELTGYLARRQFDGGDPAVYHQVEQTVIARDLAQPVEDVGVTIITQPGPGFPRDRTYPLLEGGSRAELLANLAGVISGPEFRTEYATGPDGLPACILRIAYPRAGGPKNLVLSVPGSATGYRAAWDADELGTRTYVIGDLPEGAQYAPGVIGHRPYYMTDRQVPNPELRDLPRLDWVEDCPGTWQMPTLYDRAQATALVHEAPALDLSAASGLTDPPFGSYAPGDDVTVRLLTPLLPDGLDVTARLAEMTVSAGEGTVSWTVTTAQPPPRPRQTLAARLARTETTQQLMFRRDLALQPEEA